MPRKARCVDLHSVANWPMGALPSFAGGRKRKRPRQPFAMASHCSARACRGAASRLAAPPFPCRASYGVRVARWRVRSVNIRQTPRRSIGSENIDGRAAALGKTRQVGGRVDLGRSPRGRDFRAWEGGNGTAHRCLAAKAERAEFARVTPAHVKAAVCVNHRARSRHQVTRKREWRRRGRRDAWRTPDLPASDPCGRPSHCHDICCTRLPCTDTFARSRLACEPAPAPTFPVYANVGQNPNVAGARRWYLWALFILI